MSDEKIERIVQEIEEKIQDAEDHIAEKENYEDYRDALTHKQGLQSALGVVKAVRDGEIDE